MLGKKSKLVELDAVFNFGKHVGETVRSVISYDHTYIRWCRENIGWFKVSEEVQEAISDRVNTIYQRQNAWAHGCFSKADWSDFDTDFGGFNSFW